MLAFRRFPPFDPEASPIQHHKRGGKSWRFPRANMSASR